MRTKSSIIGGSIQEANSLREDVPRGEGVDVSVHQYTRNTYRTPSNFFGCLRRFDTLDALRSCFCHKLLYLLRIDIADDELGLLRLLGCNVHGHSVAHISDPNPPISH